MESCHCNLCQKNTWKILLPNVSSWEHAGQFQIQECRFCGLVSLHPRPTPQEIGKYYPSESYWGKDVSSQTNEKISKSEIAQREKDYGFLYRHISAHCQVGKVLDVGAGTGVFLSGLQDRGWEVQGIEFSQAAVDSGNHRFGQILSAGDFLDHTFRKESLDLVTFNNSLEHLYDPLQTLKEAAKTLKKGGVICITVPNRNGLGFWLFGKNWYALQPPRHLYHFTPRTLSLMLRQANLEVVTINHWYWTHTYAAIFESFRLRFSPRFRTSTESFTSTLEQKSEKTTSSPLKQAGIISFRVLSYFIAGFGSLIGRGETITVLAKKLQ